jgi:hypothetical protein
MKAATSRGGQKGNHPTPAQIARAATASKCRMWVTNPVNFGGYVTAEVHVVVAASDAMTAARKVRALPGVKTVRVLSTDQFRVPPVLPTDAPQGSYACRGRY